MNFTKCPFHLRTAVSCHFGWAKGANKRANVQTKRHGRGGGRSDPSVRGRLAEPRRGASPGAPRSRRGQGQNCGLVTAAGQLSSELTASDSGSQSAQKPTGATPRRSRPLPARSPGAGRKAEETVPARPPAASQKHLFRRTVSRG